MKKGKMDWKKIGFKILYPHPAVIICLLPIATAFLVLSLLFLGSSSPLAILSYLFSLYVLITLCARIPRIIDFFKTFKRENKYAQKWFSDVHLRMNVSLYGALIWNLAYAIFQLGLGFFHKSFWYGSMFLYYLTLGIMRFFLVKHTRKHKAGEKEEIEIKRYVQTGWLLLFINLALSVIIFFIVYWNRTFSHHQITIIGLAAYTFLTFTFAIINLVKYKKYNSPIYLSAKVITLVSACVSMLTLETSMLTAFGTKDNPLFNRILIGATGGAIILFTLTLAIIMIVKGCKQLKKLKQTKTTLSPNIPQTNPSVEDDESALSQKTEPPESASTPSTTTEEEEN